MTLAAQTSEWLLTEEYDGRRLPPSSLPWYAVNGKDPMDKLFTDRGVAAHCYDVFRRVAQDNGYDLSGCVFVEPSAGEGCFTDLLPENRIALDIDPQADGIQKADFLSWFPPRSGRYAVIGNPPFGVRGAIALEFLNRAARFAGIVGFILPMTFASDGKGGAMTRVKGLKLFHSEELPPDSFYAKEGADRSINTLFQVWARGVAEPVQYSCDQYVEIRTVCTAPSRRCGTRRMAEYHGFISGTFYDNRPPTLVPSFDLVNYGSGYGIIVKDSSLKESILGALARADWLEHSSRSTNHCRHIRMRHIREVLTEAGYVDRSLTA